MIIGRAITPDKNQTRDKGAEKNPPAPSSSHKIAPTNRAGPGFMFRLAPDFRWCGLCHPDVYHCHPDESRDH